MSAAPATRRTGWADPVKGAAISMVVAFHASLYLAPVGVDAVIGRAKVLFELFPMPAFFLLAGMAAAGHPAMAFRALWWRRIAPVVYVYLLWSLLRTTFYAVVPGLSSGLGDLPADDWRTVLLLPVWPSSSYWFLWALAIFTAARWAAARLPAAVQLGGAAALSAATTSGWLAVPNVGWTRLLSLFVFFVAGALLAPRLKRAVDASRPWHLAAVAAGLLAVAAGLLLGLRPVPGVALVGQGLAVVLGVLVCAHLPAGRLRAGLASLGSHSFRVYLIHIFPIVVLTTLVGLLDPSWPRAVDAAVQTALIVVVLWGSWQFARRVSVRWLFAPPDALTPRNRTSRPEESVRPTAGD